MKAVEWWRSTATHMWRTYFSLEKEHLEKDTTGERWEKISEPDKKFYAICQDVLHTNFGASDQAILRMYFTSRWGDDQYAVEDYSLRTNTPTTVIWIVIRRANRLVMESVGFLERKQDGEKK